jgi:glyoxylase-like metal-dependent hydrolase (beta-lactamase superfamily II)
LQAVRCETADGEAWIVGDAILDRSWLSNWMFYWPNGYEGAEVVETWRSVSKILDAASVVIPGHGPPIFVDADLLRGLLDRFPRAFQSQQCPEVAAVLRRRLQQMS